MRTGIQKIIIDFPKGVDNMSFVNHYCSTNIDNSLAKVIFFRLDTFVQRAIVVINNNFGDELFSKNEMNLLMSEDDINELIIDYVKRTYGNDKRINSSKEDHIRAFNFIKPQNLLPSINYKIYTLRFQAITKDGQNIRICVNPFFYGFLLSYVIQTFTLFSGYTQEEVGDDLISILKAKYGADMADIFWEVAESFNTGVKLSRERRDRGDESFIRELTKISGLPSESDFEKQVYQPFNSFCQRFIEELKSNG